MSGAKHWIICSRLNCKYNFKQRNNSVKCDKGIIHINLEGCCEDFEEKHRTVEGHYVRFKTSSGREIKMWVRD